MAEKTLQTSANLVKPSKKDKNLKSNKFLEFCRDNKGYLYMMPAFIFLLVFTIYPIFNTVISSFKNGYTGLTGEFSGIGVENYIKVVSYKKFTNALTNTLLFALISVPLSLLIALMISVWLNQIKFLQKIYQTLFFLPYLTNAMAIGAVFAAMFNVVGAQGTNLEPASSVGFMNNLMKVFGAQPILWVNPGASLWAQRFVVILYSTWSSLPFKILIIFSALQSVNKQYYDAAKVDGTSKFRTLWKITVPLISPTLSYLLVTGFIGGLKAYSAIVGIFGPKMGARKGEMNTMVGFIYDSIGSGRTGVASAGSIILFGIILVFTLINLGLSKRRVHY